MANELNISAAVSFAKSGQSFDTSDMDLLGQTLTVAGANHIRATVSATTSAAALGKGGITTCGLLIGKNRGSANILIRSGAAGADVVLFPPGIGFAVYLATSTPYVSSSTGTVVFEYIMVEA